MSTIVTRAGKGSPLIHTEVDANFTNLDTDKLEVGAALNAAVAATPAVTANTAKVTNATHTGDVTGATALTIANDAVTNAKAANMATGTIKGRATAGTGDPEDLTGAQATALLDTFTSGAKGLVPASGGGTTNFLRADGTFAAPPGGGGSPGAATFVAYNDFLSILATNDWTINGQGAGNTSSAIASPDGTGVGWVEISTGTTTTGRVRAVSAAFNLLNFDNGDVSFRGLCRIPVLSDGTETFTLRVGFIDNNGTESTDGAFFRYTHSVNSGKWQAVTRGGGVETAADTGITSAATTNYAMQVDVIGGTATFYINGALVATISTDVPSGSGEVTGFGFFVQKSAGTTPRTLQIDYGFAQQSLTRN